MHIRGAYIMPGGVDAHVHLCQDLMSGTPKSDPSDVDLHANPVIGPHGLGGECADNFETGFRSAAAGGTTTMITFAPQSRAESDRSLVGVLETYRERAEATGSYIDYGFHIIIVRNDEDVLRDELPILVRDWGVTSCKLFMTYEAQRLSDGALLDVMWAAKKNGITTVCLECVNVCDRVLICIQMIHAENGDAIEWLSSKTPSTAYFSRGLTDCP
jgi:dihydropyrimidinase